MSNGGASKTLDDLLTAMLEEQDDDEPLEVSATEMKAMVAQTNALIDRLHSERTMRRLAEHEQARRKRAQAIQPYGEPLPSREHLVAELRALEKAAEAAGKGVVFHAMKFQDAGPEDLAEMIVSLRHLLKGGGREG